MRAALTAIAALVLAATAGAASQKSIPVSPGDTIDVTGTPIACFVVNTQGKKGIGCFAADDKGLIPTTYGAAIAADGEVVVHGVNAKRQAVKVFKRTLQSVAGHYYKVTVGDSFGFEIKGGFLGCRVIDVKTGAAKFRGRKVSCWRATETTPFPNGYGISVADAYAGVFRFDAKGVADGDVFVRFNPRR